MQRILTLEQRCFGEYNAREQCGPFRSVYAGASYWFGSTVDFDHVHCWLLAGRGTSCAWTHQFENKI